MRAGLLNERVRFYVNKDTIGDYGKVTQRILIAEKSASVLFEKGRNAAQSYALTQSQTLVVKVRFDKSLLDAEEIDYYGATYQLNKPLVDRHDYSMQFIAELIEDNDE